MGWLKVYGTTTIQFTQGFPRSFLFEVSILPNTHEDIIYVNFQTNKFLTVK